MTVVVLPVGLTYVVDEAGAAVVTVAGAGFWTVRPFLYSPAAVAATSTNAKTKRCMTFSLPSVVGSEQRCDRMPGSEPFNPLRQGRALGPPSMATYP